MCMVCICELIQFGPSGLKTAVIPLKRVQYSSSVGYNRVSSSNVVVLRDRYQHQLKMMATGEAME